MKLSYIIDSWIILTLFIQEQADALLYLNIMVLTMVVRGHLLAGVSCLWAAIGWEKWSCDIVVQLQVSVSIIFTY